MMSVDTVPRTLAVAALVAFACATMVSTAVQYLRPKQVGFETLERYRAILAAAGVVTLDASDSDVARAYRILDVRVVDLQTDWYADDVDPESLDHWASGGGLSAGLGGEDLSRYVPVYQMAEGTSGIVLPVDGAGMWSTIYAFVALEPDYNTIRDVVFYQHGETPGIGDRIHDRAWRDSWRGKRLRDQSGNARFRVSKNASGEFEVDALTGATVTTVATGELVQQWAGEAGFAGFLDKLAQAER